MFNLLALIIGKRYWRIHSIFIRQLLLLHGIEVGKNFYIEGIPKLKIRGKARNIRIGNNVSVLGDIDLRNREQGKIFIEDHVTIERDCRFVAAREGTLSIGEGSVITAFAIINGGGDIIIGNKCVIGPRASLNANEHLYARDQFIRDQGFTHAAIHIEDDCWLAANVCINKGVRLTQGTVIGANSVVTKSTDKYSINVGVPARKIAERT